MNATSARFGEFSSKWSARFCAIASSAVGVFADRVSTCQGREGPEAIACGASSRIACALVPPIPSEVTPARRGLPSLSQSRSLVFT